LPALKIISKKDGFRRCGVAHPAAPVIHPDGTFTPDQIAILKAEPMLIVEEIPDEKPPKNGQGPKDSKADKEAK
jgi:hypothetical protein